MSDEIFAEVEFIKGNTIDIYNEIILLKKAVHSLQVAVEQMGKDIEAMKCIK